MSFERSNDNRLSAFAERFDLSDEAGTALRELIHAEIMAATSGLISETLMGLRQRGVEGLRCGAREPSAPSSRPEGRRNGGSG